MRDGSRALAAAALVASALTLGACDALEPPPERAPPPDVTLRTVRLEQYSGGTLSTRVTLDELAYSRPTSRAALTNVRATPLRGGVPEGLLTAGAGEADFKRGGIELEGGVVFASAQQDRLETARCSLDLAGRTAEGHDPVQLHGPGYHVQAPAFTGRFAPDPRFELTGGVRAILDAAPIAPAPPPARRRHPRSR